MSTIDSVLASSMPLHARLEQRLANLKDGLHRAYCLAVCLDRALRYNATDDSPELAVCVHDYLVRPLDALSVEADELRQAFEAAPTDEPQTADQGSSGEK